MLVEFFQKADHIDPSFDQFGYVFVLWTGRLTEKKNPLNLMMPYSSGFAS